MAGGKHSAKKIQLEERRQYALELRKGGMSYRDIASAVKHEYGLERYGHTNAKYDVDAVVSAYTEDAFSSAKELVAMELSRLDDLQAALWNDALSGKMDAVDRVLRVMQQRADLLGLPTIGLKLMVEQLAGEANTTVVDGSFRIIEVVKDYGDKA